MFDPIDDIVLSILFCTIMIFWLYCEWRVSANPKLNSSNIKRFRSLGLVVSPLNARIAELTHQRLAIEEMIVQTHPEQHDALYDLKFKKRDIEAQIDTQRRARDAVMLGWTRASMMRSTMRKTIKIMGIGLMTAVIFVWGTTISLFTFMLCAVFVAAGVGCADYVRRVRLA